MFFVVYCRRKIVPIFRQPIFLHAVRQILQIRAWSEEAQIRVRERETSSMFPVSPQDPQEGEPEDAYDHETQYVVNPRFDLQLLIITVGYIIISPKRVVSKKKKIFM